MSDYPEFLNGDEIPEGGMQVTVNKVKRFINQNKQDGFAGFFVEIETPLGKRTLSASFRSVLEDLLMQKLEGISFSLYCLSKDTDNGVRHYITTRKEDEAYIESPKSRNTNMQQRQHPPNTSRRYGR